MGNHGSYSDSGVVPDPATDPVDPSMLGGSGTQASMRGIVWLIQVEATRTGRHHRNRPHHYRRKLVQ